MINKMPKKTQKGGGIHWEIGGINGNRFLRFWLMPGDMIIADGGSMAYMDDSITLQLTKPKNQKGGIFSKMKKALAGESFFQSYFVAGDKPHAILTLSTPLPSDIIAIPIKEGETWKLTAGAFLAATPNVKISGKFAFKGIFTGESAILTTATSVEGDGIVWIEAYGHIEQHELNAGEGLKVDNECFVACPSEVNYTLSKAGKSLLGSFFSGEGIIMNFKGPATVFTSTNGVGSLANFLRPLVAPSNNNGYKAVGTFGGIAADILL
jgi:uncharacterized protein (TIGR00266 family)